MTIDPIERWSLVFSAGAVATSLVVASPTFATSVAVGAALEAVNFRSLRRSAQLLFSGEIAGQRMWSAVYAVRFVLLAIGIVGAVYFGANVIGLALGLSLVVPATILEAWRTRPPVNENAPALDPDDPGWDRWNAWLVREEEEIEGSEGENL